LHRELAALSRRAHRVEATERDALERAIEDGVRQLDEFSAWRSTPADEELSS
jgi:hypothetical protein